MEGKRKLRAYLQDRLNLNAIPQQKLEGTVEAFTFNVPIVQRKKYPTLDEIGKMINTFYNGSRYTVEESLIDPENGGIGIRALRQKYRDEENNERDVYASLTSSNRTWRLDIEVGDYFDPEVIDLQMEE